MKKLSLGRKIVLVVAGILLLAGIFFLVKAYQYHKQFYEWVEAEPINIEVDMSKPGKYSGQFHQTCAISHGEELLLQLPADKLKEMSPKAVVGPLEFHCSITNEIGEEVVSSETARQINLRDEYKDGAIPLLYFHPFENGTYHLVLSVTKSNQHLADVPQRLIARYVLCGLEMMPARVSMIAGIVALLIAGVIMLVLFKKPSQKTG